MRIVHRITSSDSSEYRAELATVGVSVPPLSSGGTGLVTAEIDEDQPNWPQVAEWISRRKPFHLIRTEFTRDEIAAAPWLELTAEWQGGYPEPHDTGEWRARVYDTAEYCGKCGTGARQRAPFQLKSMRWGKRSIRQLHWVEDEFFVTPELYEAVFQPRRIAAREVRSPKGAVLDDIIQLDITATVEVDVSGFTLDQGAACQNCGRKKYLGAWRGPQAAPLSPPESDIAKSTAWFGSGGLGRHMVLISQELAHALTSRKVHGAMMFPANRTEANGSPR